MSIKCAAYAPRLTTPLNICASAMNSKIQSDAVKVVYTLPDSPKSRIRYSSLPGGLINLTTPSRKRRQHKFNSSPSQAKRGVHRPKSLSTVSSSSPTCEPIPQDIASEVYDEPSSSVGWEPSDEGVNEYSVLMEDKKFMFFVEAVCSDQCAFLQLAEDIFVANDWNMSKDEATVRHSIPCPMCTL